MSGALEALRRKYGGHEPGMMGARRTYAVLCPFVEQEDGLHLLFEVRSATVRQAGEVCFPGGQREADESFVECALRETEEELSIPRSEITLLGQSDFTCGQRGFLLQPVLGLVSPAGIAAMTPSPDEVAEVFTVPLEFFRTTPAEVYTYTLTPNVPEDFPYEAVGIPRDYPWARGRVEVPIWHWQGRVIWGLTARIVQDICKHL